MGDAFSEAFKAFIIGIITITILATLVIVKVVPWLWNIVKPWLHALTS